MQTQYNENNILGFFYDICSIPRASGNRAGIAEFLMNFARERGYDVTRDESDNILIIAPATEGYENEPTVILQGHSDMVAVGDGGRDPAKDGVTPRVEGEFLRAEGTSLGADDGVSVAYMMALLDDRTIPHPRLECLVTSDEEIGLIGAKNFDAKRLTGKRLINLDSEEEGVFTVGCAGGRRCDLSLPVSWEKEKKSGYLLTVSGLAGGHSGTEIGKGRTNALKVLGKIFSLAEEVGIRAGEVSGGCADNAIAKDATAFLAADEGQIKALLEKAKKADLGREVPTVSAHKSAELQRVLDKNSHILLARMLNAAPYGVLGMSADIPDLVETSANPGILSTEENTVTLTVSVRSSVAAKKEEVVALLSRIAKEVGADFSTRGDYPAWEYRKESRLCDALSACYREMTGKDPIVQVVHAGLECGIFSSELPNLECISIGPDLYGIHTAGERMSLPSFLSTWRFLKKFLSAKGV